MIRQYSPNGPPKKARRAQRHNGFAASPAVSMKPVREATNDLPANSPNENWVLATWVKRLPVIAGMVATLLAILTGITAMIPPIPRYDTRISVGELTISSDPKRHQARLVLHLQAEEYGNADNELHAGRAWLRSSSLPSSSDIQLDGDISLRDGPFRKPSQVIAHGGTSRNLQCWIVLSIDRAGEFLEKAGTRSLVVELKDKHDKVYTKSFCFDLDENVLNLSQPGDISYGNQYLLGCG